MSELSIITKDHLPALNEDKAVLFNHIRAAVAQAYQDTRSVVLSDIETNYLLNGLTDAIKLHHPSIRAVEIPDAISRGIRKEYGEYYGLSLVTFEFFIAEYLKSELHKNRMKAIQAPEVSKEPTEDKKFTDGKDFVLSCYDSEVSGKDYSLLAVAAYTFLKDIDLIDKSYRTGLVQEAMERLVSEKEIAIGYCTDIYKRRRLKAEYEILTDGIMRDALTADQWDEVKRMGKRLALRNYFRDCQINSVNLSQLIEDKRP